MTDLTCTTALISLLFVACGESGNGLVHREALYEPLQVTAPLGPKLPAAIVSIEWLLAHQDDKNLTLIDARSEESYSRGHLPGAINLDYELTYDKETERRWNIASLRSINRLFSDKGIAIEDTVVIYGTNKDFRACARLFWVFEVYGHPSVGVLDCNVANYVAQGRELEQRANVLPPSRFVGELQPGRLVSKLEVKQALSDESVALLDTRSHDQFLGENGWKGLDHWGRIPGSINLPPEDLYGDGEPGCSLPDMSKLPSVYREFGRKQVITYCNTGHEATVSYLYFRALGMDVAVYDGSWMEWSADPLLPRAKGKAKTDQVGARPR